MCPSRGAEVSAGFQPGVPGPCDATQDMAAVVALVQEAWLARWPRADD